MANLQLRDDWLHVLKRAWSIRFIIAAGALGALDGILQALIGAGVLTVSLAILAFIVNMAAFVARIVVQQDMAPHA
jgi:hypothetical protein